MNRRGFLGAILAAGVAPAVVRAESIMRIAAPKGWSVTEGEVIVLAGDPYDRWCLDRATRDAVDRALMDAFLYGTASLEFRSHLIDVRMEV